MDSGDACCLEPVPQPLEDMAECCICLELYTKEVRAPVTIPCGHTFCKLCVNKFIKAKVIQCCICNVVTIGFTEISKNYAMLQMLKNLNLLADDDNLVKPESVECYNANVVPEKFYNEISEEQFHQYCQFYLGFMKNYLNSGLGKTITSTKQSDFQNAICKTDQVITALKKCFETPKNRCHNPPDPFFHLARTRAMLLPDLLTVNDPALFHAIEDDGKSGVFVDSTDGMGQFRHKRARPDLHSTNDAPPQLNLDGIPSPLPPPPMVNDLQADIALFDQMLDHYPLQDVIHSNVGGANHSFNTSYGPYGFQTTAASLSSSLFPSYDYNSPSSSAPTNQASLILPAQATNAFNFGGSNYGLPGPSTHTNFDYSQPSTSKVFNFAFTNEPSSSASGSIGPFPTSAVSYNNTLHSFAQLRQQFTRHQRTVSRFPYSRAQ